MSEYLGIHDLLARPAPHFILVLDGIEDPHNFGAILRTAECAGVTGVVIRKKRQVQVTDTVIKVSTGAANLLKIARVPNIAEAISFLKEEGIKCFGLENRGGEDYTKPNFNESIALVIGGEGRGLSHLVSERCDQLIKIPMKGKISSLNTSVAAGIVMYEVVRQRD